MICIQTESLVDGLLKFSSKAEVGVTITDLDNYIRKIKESINQRKEFEDGCIIVRLNDTELDRLVSKYPKYFKKRLDRIEKGESFEHCNFSYLVGDKLQRILKAVAYCI